LVECILDSEPAGIAKVFPSETQFAFAIFRTQLLGPNDMPNVIKVQSGYRALPLSQFLGHQPPPAPPQPQWPTFTDNALKTDAFAFLNFLVQFAPTVPQEVTLRSKLAEIGARNRRARSQKHPCGRNQPHPRGRGSHRAQ
jgi:hypothetical protein